jgi:hypothetical protein
MVELLPSRRVIEIFCCALHRPGGEPGQRATVVPCHVPWTPSEVGAFEESAETVTAGEVLGETFSCDPPAPHPTISTAIRMPISAI